MTRATDRLEELIRGKKEKAEGQRKLTFEQASAIKPRPVRWAWDTAPRNTPPQFREGRFPIGSLVIAVGRAGVGKSQFACWATAGITKGTLPGEFYGKPRSVVYAATEDSWDMTIVPRLMATGADLDRVFRVSVTDDEDTHARLTLPSDTTLLEQGITDHDVAMVVLDPLLSLIDATINDYRAREVREALEPFVAVADRTKVLLLGLAHFTKATGSDPLMLVSGSAAFGQLVRAAVAFARDDDEEAIGNGERPPQRFVCSTIKNNLGREDLPSLAYEIEAARVDTDEGDAWVSRLKFTGEPAARSVRDILRAAGAVPDPEEQHERQTVALWLTDYLTATDKAPSKDVKKAARAAGFSERTLQRARAQLRVVVTDEGFPRTTYWSLPVTVSGGATPNTGTEAGTTGNNGTDQCKHGVQHSQSCRLCHTHARGTTGTTGDQTRLRGVTESDGWRVSGRPVETARPAASDDGPRPRRDPSDNRYNF